MDPAGFPLPQKLGHLQRIDVLVRVLRVVRGEEPGQLFPHVVDELGQRPQPGQDDQVPVVEPLPQLLGRDVWIGQRGWHRIPTACRASHEITSFVQVKASA